MLRRRCSNVVTTSWQRRTATLSQRRRPTSPQLSFWAVPRRCDNVSHDVLTTLSRSRCASWVRRGFSQKLSPVSKTNANIKFQIFGIIDSSFIHSRVTKPLEGWETSWEPKTTWDVSEDACSLSKHFLSLHFLSLSIIISLCWVNKLFTNKNFHSQETQTWHFKVRILFIKRCYSKF